MYLVKTAKAAEDGAVVAVLEASSVEDVGEGGAFAFVVEVLDVHGCAADYAESGILRVRILVRIDGWPGVRPRREKLTRTHRCLP